MQRRLDSHVAAFGEQNRDKIVAVPSNTGQGVHLYFDPERSLSPDPEQAVNRQCTDSTEDVVVVDDPDSESSLSSLSDLESDLETVAPDTPPRGQAWPSSHLHTPKAPRHIKQENFPERSVDPSSSVRVHDSLALHTEHKKALKAHLNGDVEDPHHILEQDDQKMIHQARNEEERFEAMREACQGSVEQFRQKNPMIFLPSESVSEYSEPLSPEPFECGDFPPEVSHPTLPQSAGPSRLGQAVNEDRKQHQQYTPLRRQNALRFTPSSRDEAAESVGADGQFVVVARRVQRLGPCGTVVLDHDTGDDELVTKRYRVHEEELFSIDGDGDSVMGSDD
jgi:hypothetical protein